MKLYKKLVSCILALSASAVILYADILSEFPSEIAMNQNEAHNRNLGMGVYINIPDEVCASSKSDTVTPIEKGSYNGTLSVANIPFKKVKVNISEHGQFSVSGELVGIRIHNKGLIVTDLAPVQSGGNEVCPAQEKGILPGDVILEINGIAMTNSDDVSSAINNNAVIKLERKGVTKTLRIAPVRDDSDDKLKLGLWVRDSSAGVGTLTFINPATSFYGALGHGISEADTGVLFNVSRGSIEKSSVISIQKGKKGVPGQICGSFSSANNISGNVIKNCESGIFGAISSTGEFNLSDYPIGVMSQVKTGNATILSAVDGEVKEYNIKILRTMPYGSASKGLYIEITDPELLSLTGGIVQGMSGSPIIQNNKLIGAVTHVLVNDPSRGYGIFIENMLKEAG